jgi:protein-tyrosine phosphatase
MNQIVPYPIWIGHAGESHEFGPIFEAGIEAVIELAAEEPMFSSRRDLISCRFPVLDGPGNRPEVLALAVGTVASLVAAGIPTLVCCGAGMSRAPAVVAAALALLAHEAPQECLIRVTRHHPSDVSPGLWDEISQLPPTAFEIPRLVQS